MVSRGRKFGKIFGKKIFGKCYLDIWGGSPGFLNAHSSIKYSQEFCTESSSEKSPKNFRGKIFEISLDQS